MKLIKYEQKICMGVYNLVPLIRHLSSKFEVLTVEVQLHGHTDWAIHFHFNKEDKAKGGLFI